MEAIINKYSQWVARHAKILVGIILTLTVVMAAQLLFLEINPTPYFLDKSHPSRVSEDKVKTLFTNTGETGVIALVTTAPSIFNVHTLANVTRLTAKFKAMSIASHADTLQLTQLALGTPVQDQINAAVRDGLDFQDTPSLALLRDHLYQQGDTKGVAYIAQLMRYVRPVTRVRSLATLENLTQYQEYGEDIIDVHPLMEAVPKDPAALRALAAEVMANPILVGTIVAEDQRATSIYVELSLDADDAPSLVKAYEKIAQIIAEAGLEESTHLGGPPMVTSQTSRVIQSDNNRLVPLVILVVGLTLLVCFRRIQGVVIPLTIAIITTIWTLGVMSLVGIAQNIVTTMLPVFLISIAVADAIHFLNAYYVRRQQLTSGAAIADSFQRLFTPLLLTSVTSVVGFLVISNTHLTFLKEFGWFVALGIGIAFLLTVTLLPALLHLFDGLHSPAQVQRSARNLQVLQMLSDYTVAIVVRVTNQPWVVLTLLAILIAASAVVLPNLKVDNEAVGFFDEQSKIRQDTDQIKRRFDGTTPLNLWFYSEQENVFKDPDILVLLERMAKHLEQLEPVGGSLSIVDFVKHSNQVIAQDQYALPRDATSAVVSQYLFFYENSTTQDLRDIVDLAYKNTRIIIILKNDVASEIKTVVQAARQFYAENFPAHIKMEINGFGEILLSSTEEIVFNQITNVSIAFVVILILLVVLFRSFVLAIFALIPLGFCVAFTYAIMSVANIPLDIGTSIISCIAFGVGIDYAIHFLSALRANCIVVGGDYPRAVELAIQQVASPIIVNSVSLSLGFLVLTFSSYAAIVHLGMMVALAMLLCALLTLLVLPVLVKVVQPGTLLPLKVAQQA